jgi:hypothetical protein
MRPGYQPVTRKSDSLQSFFVTFGGALADTSSLIRGYPNSKMEELLDDIV